MKALVTGGCKGLGAAFSKYLATLGYDVYALYNSSEESALKLSKDYSNIHVLKCDIKNEDSIKKIADKIDDIDLLINNAGVAIDNDYKDKTKNEFMEVLETNLVGTFLMIKYFAEKINGGAIINISSNNTLGNHSPLSMDYDASKAGINMLTKDFALALVGIKVIAYAPGWIDTESIREANPLYINEEMKKVNQSKLINPDELVKYIIDDYMNQSSGSIIEIKEL